MQEAKNTLESKARTEKGAIPRSLTTLSSCALNPRCFLGSLHHGTDPYAFTLLLGLSKFARQKARKLDTLSPAPSKLVCVPCDLVKETGGATAPLYPT